jgi:pseudoazurin
MRNTIRSVLFPIALLFLISACGDNNSSQQKNASPPAATTAAPAETMTPAAPPTPPAAKATAPAAPAPAPDTTAAVAPAASATTLPAPKSGKAQTVVINAEARAFNPDIVYIQPGDTVQWTNMTSHTSTSIGGLIPAGATPWNGQLGENLQVTLTVPGIYGYYCIPDIGFGMMGVIVVGKPTNLDEVKAYADKNMQGPFRRILGKLNKVVIP